MISSKDVAAWIERRRRGIGGSDIAALAGLDPYKTAFDVFASKLGLGDDDVSRVPAVRRGRIMEALVVELIEEDTGAHYAPAVASGQVLVARDAAYAIGTPDRYRADREGAGLEVKTTTYRQRRDWEDGRVTDRAFAQVQWYMRIDPSRTVYEVAGYFVDARHGKGYVVVDVERDERAVDGLDEIARAFWFQHVVPCSPPLPDADATEEWARIGDSVARLYAGQVAAEVAATPELVALAEEYDGARASESAAALAKEAARAKLLAALAGASGAIWPGGSVRQRPNAPRVRWEEAARTFRDELVRAVDALARTPEFNADVAHAFGTVLHVGDVFTRAVAACTSQPTNQTIDVRMKADRHGDEERERRRLDRALR